MPHSCALRAPPCWQAARFWSSGAPFQFGPVQPVQFPPGEVCHMVQSCSSLSVTHSSTRPSFCCAAVTCSTPACTGPEPIGDHPAQVPPGVSWKLVISVYCSVTPQICAPRVPPCCEAAICTKGGAFCHDGSMMGVVRGLGLSLGLVFAIAIWKPP